MVKLFPMVGRTIQNFVSELTLFDLVGNIYYGELEYINELHNHFVLQGENF